jgi:hypothetical protein
MTQKVYGNRGARRGGRQERTWSRRRMIAVMHGILSEGRFWPTTNSLKGLSERMHEFPSLCRAECHSDPDGLANRPTWELTTRYLSARSRGRNRRNRSGIESTNWITLCKSYKTRLVWGRCPGTGARPKLRLARSLRRAGRKTSGVESVWLAVCLNVGHRAMSKRR